MLVLSLFWLCSTAQFSSPNSNINLLWEQVFSKSPRQKCLCIYAIVKFALSKSSVCTLTMVYWTCTLFISTLNHTCVESIFVQSAPSEANHLCVLGLSSCTTNAMYVLTFAVDSNATSRITAPLMKPSTKCGAQSSSKAPEEARSISCKLQSQNIKKLRMSRCSIRKKLFRRLQLIALMLDRRHF